MKLQIFSAILVLTGIFFTGCKKDYLQVVPDSEYSIDGFYKTQIDFQQAIAGVYAQQQSIYNRTTQLFYLIILPQGDEVVVPQFYAEGVDIGTADVNGGSILSEWSLLWKIIYQNNLILDKISQGAFADTLQKRYITGEAYIFRAWAYWMLSYQFGGMPLIDKPISVAEILTVPRSTVEETFNFIEADYKKAIDLLPEEWTGANKGRATKYAAMGMLARLYMFQSNFSKALPLLNGITASTKYVMEPTYLGCFLDSKDNGPERVWEVQYTGGQLGEGTNVGPFFLPGSSPFDPAFFLKPETNYTTINIIDNVSQSLYWAFTSTDKRRDVSFLKKTKMFGVLDTNTVYCKKFAHFDAYTPKDGNDWANNFPILRYTDVLMMKAEALNEVGYTADGEAFSILNSVRQRAGIKVYTSGDLPDQTSFRNAIRKERKLEFAFEGLRSIDLLRWGNYIEVKNLWFALPENWGGKYSLKNFNKILPIPSAQITANNNTKIMWQNPGY